MDGLGDRIFRGEAGAFLAPPDLEILANGRAPSYLTARRAAAAKPLISRSMAKSSSIRRTAFYGDGTFGNVAKHLSLGGDQYRLQRRAMWPCPAHGAFHSCFAPSAE